MAMASSQNLAAKATPPWHSRSEATALQRLPHTNVQVNLKMFFLIPSPLVDRLFLDDGDCVEGKADRGKHSEVDEVGHQVVGLGGGTPVLAREPVAKTPRDAAGHSARHGKGEPPRSEAWRSHHHHVMDAKECGVLAGLLAHELRDAGRLGRPLRWVDRLETWV